MLKRKLRHWQIKKLSANAFVKLNPSSRKFSLLRLKKIAHNNARKPFRTYLFGLAILIPLIFTLSLSPASSAPLLPIEATATVSATPTTAPTATPFPLPKIERVLIVSFDGLRPDAIEKAPMPNVQAMIQNGAYTLSALTISDTSTLPAHTSMLSGMCQSKHGVNWNQLLYYRGYSKGTDLFDLTTQAGLKSVMIVGKEKLRLIAQPETTSVFEMRYFEESIAEEAVLQISAGFDLMFVHFPSADERGHKYGWMTNAQFKSLREADQGLGAILVELERLDMLSTTLIIVTADHGGHENLHDGSVREDITIPWIAYGARVIPSQIQSQVRIMDTAATAAYFLNLPIPQEWDGVPIFEILGIPTETQSIKC